MIKLEVLDGKVQSEQEIYSDDGHRLWGSSSAVGYESSTVGKGLLIGTIHHKLAYCTLEKGGRVQVITPNK